MKLTHLLLTIAPLALALPTSLQPREDNYIIHGNDKICQSIDATVTKLKGGHMTSDNVSEVISKALAAIDHELKCPVGTNAVNPPSEVCKIKAGIEKEIMVLLVAKKMDEIAAVYEMLGTALGCRHALAANWILEDDIGDLMDGVPLGGS